MQSNDQFSRFLRAVLRTFAVAAICAPIAIWACCEVGFAEDASLALCSDGRTKIAGASSDEFSLICSAAEATMKFLRNCGLSLPSSLQIEIAKESLQVGGQKTFGCYDADRNVILLLNFANCSKAAAKSKAYASLPADQFYKSIVVHEVAHRVFQSNLGARKVTRGGFEYVAYAVQITLIPESARSKFLAPIKRSAPTDLSPFADMLLLMAPEAFGAMAYDHFSAPGNGCRVLRDVIEGKQSFPTWEEFD